MRLLAFDTAGDGCSAGCFAGAEPVAFARHAGASGQAERLVPMLAAVLADAGWGMEDLEALAVTIGPGSFTGIRTGLAAARGLALVRRLPAWPVTTLAALAAVADGADGLPLAVVLDARRGQVFLQRFDSSGAALDESLMLAPELAAARLREPHHLVGSGAVALLRHLDATAMTLGDAVLDAVAVARAAAAARGRGEAPVHGTALAPLYLREPDARPSAGRSLLQA
ncbi:MAG: tRNA (adenosine(37)-N6)-threonylcarbamoyltransferase complex dimerization subunit type 1 TsaB [Geminicoccaceae bacterium]|nr:tRNA (adenosine(37)-N6)-threonylcarbamoyltransferase complex dimerization subunit type 1 TsaB [Geminicoccaceae bacterium]